MFDSKATVKTSEINSLIARSQRRTQMVKRELLEKLILEQAARAVSDLPPPGSEGEGSSVALPKLSSVAEPDRLLNATGAAVGRRLLSKIKDLLHMRVF